MNGITVVSLEQAVSAPLCTRTLADFGARVIKVENPKDGDFARAYDDVVNGMAAHFVWLNRGKLSVTVDLKTAPGREVLHRLLAKADAFVTNLAPGATSRIGVDADSVRVRHPHLVACDISGYGVAGPLSDKRSYDLLVQAESGACSITGWADAPAKPGPPMANACSGLYSAISILAMLAERRRTGTGSAISVSLFDMMTELMGYALTWSKYTGADQVPVGMGSPAVAPYGAYATADGQTVVIGTTNDREWQRMAAELLGRPDLAADERYRHNPDRVARREELDAVIAEWCDRHALAEIQMSADAAGIGNARYNTTTEVVHHPHLAIRDRWRKVGSPVGPVATLLPPPVIAGIEPAMGAVPGLGEHTDTVLTEVLGLDRSTLASLRDAGAIGPAYTAVTTESET